MAKDLRHWLSNLELESGEKLLRVKKAVSPHKFEATAIMEQLDALGRREAVLFEVVRNLNDEPCRARLLMNVFGTLRKVGFTMGLPPMPRHEILNAYSRREKEAHMPIKVGRGESPVKEVIIKGGNLDLRQLPIVRHMEMDGGPYFTPVVAARERGSGRYNISWNRMMYLDGRHTAIYMSPRHLWSMVAASEKESKNLPIAVVLGHHPAVYLSAAALSPASMDEYELAGGISGEPLRLTASESYGEELLVPADAEIVIEGEIVAGRRTVEGPFGEFTKYTGPQRISWLFRALAITMRRDPIMISCFTCHDDHVNAHTPIEASIYCRVKEAMPNVSAVSWIDSGWPFTLVISIDKKLEGEPMRAAMAAMSAGNFIKNVIIVDPDINLYDAKEVLWAVSTRAQAARDVTIIDGIQCSVLDPSLEDEIKGSGMIIDATKPAGRPFASRGGVPQEVLSKVKLEDYL